MRKIAGIVALGEHKISIELKEKITIIWQNCVSGNLENNR
jgi:hypothetical protein